MNLFLLTVVLVASASANVIQEEQNICFHVGGVEICGDPSISGKRHEEDKRIFPCYYIDGVRTCIGIKREEDLNLAEIVTNIGNVVHVIDQFVGGVATKRDKKMFTPCPGCIDGCLTSGCSRICLETGFITNICKREEQDIGVQTCYTVNGVKTCLPLIKREENINQ
ncbi:hypothetical protein Bpfe_015046 [Biomphalaria pfeifferi]|uniref:Uncharacterized protein n=1 Tax=Biomphalaria pfeifferi TaxID=112525 RepID=A0AAD8F9Z9_BIOPF|nr:hypothetical protein Bpfe_015045 [Biomphalaria pfeifferi]KAK0055535.1 hypothetical protein Bpfe_015046 [Biomphalaria pfeifferi]